MRQSSQARYSEFARDAWPRLYRVALVLVRDRHVAEDLVQTALVKTYVAWPRLRDPEKAHAFTRRVLVDTAHDWARRRSWTHESPNDLSVDHGAATADQAAAVVDQVTLADLMRTLPLGQRSVLALRYLEDLSVPETADLLHVTEGTVKSQTAAALAALRAHAHLAIEGTHHD